MSIYNLQKKNWLQIMSPSRIQTIQFSSELFFDIINSFKDIHVHLKWNTLYMFLMSIASR